MPGFDVAKGSYQEKLEWSDLPWWPVLVMLELVDSTLSLLNHILVKSLLPLLIS
jgi:hypothetical protein